MKKFNAILVLTMALFTSQWVIAQCTGTISSTNVGATYTFTSTNPTSSQQYHSWDFGDGTYGSGQTASHTYTTSGTYGVTAYFGDSINMCSDVDTLLITAVVPGGTTCSAAFTTSGNSPTFTFTPTGTPTAPPGYYSYDWDFGDGTVAWGNNNPTHTYTANGTYNVTCILYDSIWCTDSVTNTVVVTGIGSPTCDASFTVGGNGPTYFFNAPNINPGDSIIWTFGDGNSNGTSASPTHTYTANGTYNVVLGVFNGSCFDTTSATIIVTNALSTNCDASFSYIDSNGIYNFMATYPTATSTYSWTLSNGAVYSGANPIVSITQPGTYTMCMDIYDASTMCSDSSCVTFTYSPGGGVTCDASFTTTYSGNTYTFTPNALDPSAIYSWSFGDGSSSTSQIPTHTYTSNGVYTVSVNRIILNQCNDTIDTLITINNIPTTGSISGVVNMGSSYADYGVVFLVANDTSGNLALIDTTIIDSMGMYYFGNVAFGTYLVKAALSPASTNFSSYLPTYHANTPAGNNGTLLWSDAADVVLNAPFLNNIDVDLIAGVNPGGPGFIGGSVSQGANKTGDPISDINIMVYDQNGNPVAYTYSNNKGTFQISNLPFGTYTIYPEVQGRITTPITSTLTAMHPGEDEVRVTVNKSTVEVGITTSVQPLPEFADIKLYPNPVQEQLTIEMNNILEGNSIFTVTDLSGKTIQRFTSNQTNVLKINTSDWSEGMYFLTIENNGQRANFKIVK